MIRMLSIIRKTRMAHMEQMLRMSRKYFLSFSLCIVFLFTGCASLVRPVISAEEEAILYPASSYVPETFDWQEVRIDVGECDSGAGVPGAGEDCAGAVEDAAGADKSDGAEGRLVPGLWRFDFENPDIPLIYHAVKIELTGQGALGGTNNVDSGVHGARGANNVTTGVQEDSGTAGFTLLSSQWEHTSTFAAREKCLVAMNATPFDKTKLAGIYKVGGEVISEAVARYAALGLRCGPDGEVLAAQIFA